jgi:hypothetical protein
MPSAAAWFRDIHRQQRNFRSQGSLRDQQRQNFGKFGAFAWLPLPLQLISHRPAKPVHEPNQINEAGMVRAEQKNVSLV